MAKGQASLEQLIVTGLMLSFIAIAFYFAMNYASNSIRSAQGKGAIDKIGKTTDYLYSLGPYSKTTVTILIPEGIESINISDHRVLMRVSTSSGYSDAFANVQPVVNGTIEATSGPKTVTLTVNSTGTGVSITG